MFREIFGKSSGSALTGLLTHYTSKACNSRCDANQLITDSLFGGISQELDPAGHLLRRQQIVDQNHATEHFPDWHGLLLAVGDASVGHALGMEPEEIIVLRYHDTSGGAGELKVRQISRASQAHFHRGGHFDVAPPKASRDVAGNVFVQMKTNGRRSGCFLDAFRAQLRFEQGWITTAELLRKRALRPHLLLDLFDVIEVIGEGGMDIGESDGWKVGDDLVGRHALMLMPPHDVEHTDAVAGDAGLAAANTGRPADPVLGGLGHDSSINRASTR
jgi:hypothetical protein